MDSLYETPTQTRIMASVTNGLGFEYPPRSSLNPSRTNLLELCIHLCAMEVRVSFNTKNHKRYYEPQHYQNALSEIRNWGWGSEVFNPHSREGIAKALRTREKVLYNFYHNYIVSHLQN